MNMEPNPAALGRQIERDARRYAQNRNVPWFALLAWPALASGCIAAGLGLALPGFTHTPNWLTYVGLAVTAAGILLMAWILLGGMQTIWRWSMRIYRADGYVQQLSPSAVQRPPRGNSCA